MNRLYSDASKPKTTAEMFAEVWAAVGQLQTARTAEATSIGANGIVVKSGGSITVDGGTVRMLSVDGVEIFALINLSGTRAWKLAYDNGPTAIGTVGTIGSQYVSIWDRSDHAVISTDGATGVGLAEPSLNIYMVPSTGTSIGTGGPFWPEFVNASYQEVMHSITKLWHPRIAIGVDTSATSGTVDWQLRIDGVTAGSGSGDGSGTFSVPGWGTTTNPGDQRSVQLWCRNTTGTASRVIVDRCYGTKS